MPHGITVIGPNPARNAPPWKTVIPWVEIRKNWGDLWQYVPSLEFVRATRATAAQDIGSCVLKHRYGALRHPHEFGPQPLKHNPAGWNRQGAVGSWIRIWFAGVESARPFVGWFGRIASETRDLIGTETDSLGFSSPGGVQLFTAYEPLYLLNKIHVSESYWWNETEEDDKRIKWVPGMNSRDELGLIVGNRSTIVHRPLDANGAAIEGEVATFMYGGTSQWSHLAYVEYLLERFANRYNDNGFPLGPKFKLAGQLNILNTMFTVIRWPDTITVGAMLRKLIPTEAGIDFKTDYKFEQGGNAPETVEIVVHALTAQPSGYSGVELPRNPNQVRIDPTAALDMTVRLESTGSKRYSTIRLVGDRVVVLANLFGPNEVGIERNRPANTLPGIPTMVPAWPNQLAGLGEPNTLIQEYWKGRGDAAGRPEQHDAARGNSKYQDVYRAFAAPFDWDRDRYSPRIGPGGVVETLGRGARRRLIPSEYQDLVRATLPKLPLRSNIDYTTNPPTDFNESGHLGEYRSPTVWFLAEKLERYVSNDAAEISVSALQLQWGVRLGITPAHVVALHDFIPDGVNIFGSKTEPVYDWKKCVALIAMETDQRFMLEHTIANVDDGDGSVLEIRVPGAQLWFLPPNVVVHADRAGNLRYGKAQELRNDRAQLLMTMAGAIARFFNERARAEITIKHYWPSGEWLGHILTTVGQGLDTHNVQAAVTSVTWEGHKTIIRTGFAR